MNAALSVERGTVAFGGVKALNDVSVSFEKSAITGLIGPNGSGKSTMVNLMAGQLRATAGAVFLEGVQVSGRRADQTVRLGIARTFQIPNIPRQLTIEDVISTPFYYVRRQRHLPADLKDARAIAAFCGIRQDVATRCGQMSVPDLRRLEIARALACAPTVLLLDEVMAGLSLEDAHQLIEVVRRLNATGMTVVVIEHVMRIIATLCDRVVVLNHGTLLAEGDPTTVLRDSRVAEAYLGARSAV
jgi:branched-chain amino acid transport system ATP-binding protein